MAVICHLVLYIMIRLCKTALFSHFPAMFWAIVEGLYLNLVVRFGETKER